MTAANLFFAMANRDSPVERCSVRKQPGTIGQLYHYTYYVMRKEDERRKWPTHITKMRAIGITSIAELTALMSIYLLLSRIVLGHPLPKPPLPSFISPVIASWGTAIIICYLNSLGFGNESRNRRYRKIFDRWSPRKAFWYRILLVLIAVGSLAACFLAGEITQNGWNTHDWKW